MNFWSNLTAREQLAIYICGVAIVLIAFIMFVISPLMAQKQASVNALKEEKSRYYNVLSMSADVMIDRMVEKEAPGDSRTPIREAATIASRDVGIAISRIQPGTDDKISFWIEEAKTDQIFNWLIILDEKYGRTAQKVSLQKNSGQPTLRGQFEFKEGIK